MRSMPTVTEPRGRSPVAELFPRPWENSDGSASKDPEIIDTEAADFW